MAKILGIDPGSQKTGYGLVKKNGSHCQILLNGFIKPKKDTTENKLKQIFNELQTIIEQHNPTILVLEKIFYSVNFNSSMVLAQVRGVIMLLCSLKNLKLVEYSPREIKQAITGNGNASKEQVLRALHLIYKTPLDLPLDVSDALATAICHTNHSVLKIK